MYFGLNRSKCYQLESNSADKDDQIARKLLIYLLHQQTKWEKFIYLLKNFLTNVVAISNKKLSKIEIKEKY